MSPTPKIFGSPPLKMFARTKNMFGKSALEKKVKVWIEILLEENEKLKAEGHPKEGMTLSDASPLVFYVGKKLRLNSVTKFHALDIYQRFCLLHVDDLTKMVREGSVLSEDKPDFLLKTQKKVGRQTPLRMLSCLWIASKYGSHKRVLSRLKVKKFLKESGFDFALKSINRSEFRILEQLKYKCRFSNTIPEYIGILMSFIDLNLGSSAVAQKVGMEIDSVYKTAIRLLEFCYLNYELLYNDLFFKVTGSRIVPAGHEKVFSRVRCDRLLLASSVVTTAGWLHGNDTLSTPIVRALSPVIHIPEEDLNTFSACILQRLFLKKK